MLVVRLPHGARRCADDLATRLPASGRWRDAALVRAAAYAACLGVLMYLWSQAAVVLLRPPFTWLGAEPSVDAITHVQRDWEWLVLAALAAVAVRTGLERRARDAAGPRVAALERRRHASAQDRGAAWARLGPRPRALLGAAAITLLLAGAYERWFDALATFVVVAAATLLRLGELRPLPARWTTAVLGVPMILRLAIAVPVSLVVATAVVGSTTSSFRPVLVSALIALIAFVVLFASPAMVRDSGPPAAGHRRVAARLLNALWSALGFMLAVALGIPEPALADNCGSPEDCWGVLGGAAAAAAGARAVAAAWGWSPDDDAGHAPAETEDDAVDDACIEA